MVCRDQQNMDWHKSVLECLCEMSVCNQHKSIVRCRENSREIGIRTRHDKERGKMEGGVGLGEGEGRGNYLLMQVY